MGEDEAGRKVGSGEEGAASRCDGAGCAAESSFRDRMGRGRGRDGEAREEGKEESHPEGAILVVGGRRGKGSER